MKRFRRNAILELAAFLMVVPAVWAQQFTPHIGYVYPAGGKQGATFQVAIGGQYLDGVTDVFISGTGIKATVTDFNKPMNQGQFNRLRDKLKELQDKKQAALRETKKTKGRSGTSRSATNVWTDADEKMMADIRAQMLKNPPNRQGNPAIIETATVRITLTSDADLGEREIRLGTPLGLSNPLKFCVSQLPEFSKLAAKAANPDLNRFKERYGKAAAETPAKSEMRVTLPATVNGQIMPGSVDRFRFSARQGQQLVVVASARALIPYLADAVPGWFQATLALYDAKGKELAYDDDYRFHPDPVLRFEVLADGDYLLEIKDAIYRGREDFVYRVTVGELPFITCVFPLGGPAGAQTAIELKGWNLPATTLTMDARTKTPGTYPISIRKDARISNLVPFAVDTLPECLEQEPNNHPDSAQKVTSPIIVNGRIDKPGDVDVFRFEGRAGDEIVAEVQARRLDSPLDSVLKLTDSAGQQLAFNDDYEDKGSGLETHHADSYVRARLPANGACYLHLGDTQNQGGPDYAYRLRVSPPRPDFQLRVVPASISARPGMNIPLTVYALRKDGFSNSIALFLKDAPEGFKLSGGRVPANQDQVRLTLSVPLFTRKEPLTVSLEGHAIVQGKGVWRPAVPAEDMMQAFAYRHLVPAKELKVAIAGRGAGKGPVRMLSDATVKIPAGGTARVRIDVPARAFAGQFQLELSEPPEGITIKNIAPAGFTSEIVLQTDAAKVKPGLEGNLIVNAYAAIGDAAKKKVKTNQRRAALGSLPAIPFEIVER